MNTNIKTCLLLVFLSGLVCSPTFAHQCDVEAYKTVVKDKGRFDLFYSHYFSITKEEFEELKNSNKFDSAFHYAKIIGADIDKEWEKFEQKRKILKKKTRYKHSTNESRDYYLSKLEKNGRDALIECFWSDQSKVGIFVILDTEDSSNSISYKVLFRESERAEIPTKGFKVSLKFNGVQCNENDSCSSEDIVFLRRRGVRSGFINRQPNSKFTLVANTEDNLYSDHRSVPAQISFPEPTICQEIFPDSVTWKSMQKGATPNVGRCIIEIRGFDKAAGRASIKVSVEGKSTGWGSIGYVNKQEEFKVVGICTECNGTISVRPDKNSASVTLNSRPIK